MSQLLRKPYTMRLPAGAEIFERGGVQTARWRLRNGQLREAELVPGSNGLRVRGRSKFYTATYKDGNGNQATVSTGCRDATAAKAVLAKLEREAELVRAGVLTQAESDSSQHSRVPLKRHLDAYERHLRVKGGAPRRIAMVRGRLERLISECGLSRLNNMSAGALEEWLVTQAETGMSASTRNCYREALVGFGNWCRRTRRLTHNPFADVPRADPNTDRRHQRRALTVDEIDRLLMIARLRPLAEYGREVVRSARKGRSPRSRATWRRAPLDVENIQEAVVRAREALKSNPAFMADLDVAGRERELVYRMLLLTGLRKGELASLTVAHLDLDGPVAYAVLDPVHEKNRQGSSIPLRADLVIELRRWLRERLARLQDDHRARGEPVPVRLPPALPLFRIPSGLTRILDRDLAAAGIPKRDERNRVVDIHAFRHTFGTHLCAAGVPLRTAQAAMRHSKPELTANIYTDPKLLDIAGAIEALPTLAKAERPAKAAGGAGDTHDDRSPKRQAHPTSHRRTHAPRRRSTRPTPSKTLH